MQDCMKDTTSFATETGKKPVQFIKLAVSMEESVDEFRILADERCIDKGVFPNRSLLHELVFACDDIPPRPRISFTLLTQSRLVLPRGQLQGARWPCFLMLVP